MGSADWILGAVVVGGLGVVAYLYFTGYFSGGQRYDPNRTDLFPFAPKLEKARKDASDMLADLKEKISMKPG